MKSGAARAATSSLSERPQTTFFSFQNVFLSIYWWKQLKLTLLSSKIIKRWTLSSKFVYFIVKKGKLGGVTCWTNKNAVGLVLGPETRADTHWQRWLKGGSDKRRRRTIFLFYMISWSSLHSKLRKFFIFFCLVTKELDYEENFSFLLKFN